jgi:hypothetical protein
MDDTKIAEQAIEEGKNVSAKEKPSPSTMKKEANFTNGFVMLVVATVVVVAGLAIGLGLVLSNRYNHSNNNDNNNDTTPAVEKVRISDASTRSLPLISGSSLQKTYLDCDDLRVDLRKMAMLLANQTIHENLDSFYFMEDSTGSPVFAPVSAPDPGPPAQMPGQMGGRNSESVATTEDSFGTNNQVEGVEEPDSVQSDGTSIFTAYGSEVRLTIALLLSSHENPLSYKDYQSECGIANHCRSRRNSRAGGLRPARHSQHALD